MPSRLLSWTFAIAIALLVAVAPLVHYRWSYAYGKRLRAVVDDKIYRSGCQTVDGFEKTLREHRIRVVLNLQEEAPDPDMAMSYFGWGTEKESEVCRRLGVRFEFLEVDLIPPELVPPAQPRAMAKFFEIMDDPKSYPILIHCRAGLHRTGVLVALYRMEYEGWPVHRALEEMRALGFGRMPSYSPNEYIRQYLANYQPRPDTDPRSAGIRRTTKGLLTSTPAGAAGSPKDR